MIGVLLSSNSNECTAIAEATKKESAKATKKKRLRC